MKVLVTGPFGNIGTSTIEELVRQGHRVRCFARDREANRKAAEKYGDKIEVVWGDIRSPDDVAAAVTNQEAILHLAFAIPYDESITGTSSEHQPELAKQINVGGTENILRAAASLPRPPKFIFTSSVCVFGITQDQAPPRTVRDPVTATDHYTQHKLVCEEMVRASGLDWVILRICASPPVAATTLLHIQDLALDNRIEFVHPKDVGLACANAVSCEEAVRKILLIGGGPRCQLRFRDWVQKTMEAFGLEMLPDEAFPAGRYYYQDWADTAESQRLLKYQQRTYDDWIEDLKEVLGGGGVATS